MDYFAEKFWAGVRMLASSIPSQRDRLKSAFQAADAVIFDRSSWPANPDARIELEKIVAAVEPESPGGSNKNIDSMTDTQVQECVNAWFSCLFTISKIIE